MAGSLDKYTKPEKSTCVLINLPPFFYFDANYFCYLHGQFSVLGNGTLAPGTPPCSLRTCRGLVLHLYPTGFTDSLGSENSWIWGFHHSTISRIGLRIW